MGADSKNQVENMCCQHKIYDMIKEKAENFTDKGKDDERIC